MPRGIFARTKSTHCKQGHEFTEENTLVTKRGHRSCRTCNREGDRKRRHRYAETRRKWRTSPKGLEGNKRRNRKRLYGITDEQRKFALKEQGGLCAISGMPPNNGDVLVQDHNHACCPGAKSCGKCLRGLLRRDINVALGAFHDNPATLRLAADYLEKHKGA